MVAPLALMGLSAAGNVLNGVIGTISNALQGTTNTNSSVTDTTAADARDVKTRKTATDFEKMFLEQSFGHLTQKTGEDGPLGDNGTGGSVYKSMLMKEYAGQIVQSGGVGIAGQVYSQMLKMQEMQNAGA